MSRRAASNQDSPPGRGKGWVVKLKKDNKQQTSQVFNTCEVFLKKETRPCLD